MQTGALHIIAPDRTVSATTAFRVVFASWRPAGQLGVSECPGRTEMARLLVSLGVDPGDLEHALHRLALNGHAAIQAVTLSERQLAGFEPATPEPDDDAAPRS